MTRPYEWAPTIGVLATLAVAGTVRGEWVAVTGILAFLVGIGLSGAV